MFVADPPSSTASRVLLSIFVLLHVALAFWISSNTPYRTPGFILSQGRAPAADVGTPDERQHANYVAGLVEGRGYPVFRPSAPDAGERIEDHQAPLYYTLAAGFAKVVGLDADAIRSPGGKPLRLLNLLVGAFGVIGAYAFGRWGFGRREIGLIAAAFTALLPMNLAMSGSVNNDPLLIALCTWALALAAKGVREGWTTRLACSLGLVVGLAALTKTSALALLPVLGLASLFRRPNPRQLALVLVFAVLLPLPWWLRNQALYGDPFALKIFKQAFGNTAQAAPFVEGFGLFGYLFNWVAWWTARSFIGAFGYMDIWLNETRLPVSAVPNTLYRVALALLFAAFVGWAMRLRMASSEERRIHGLGFALALVVGLQFLLFDLQYFQSQARYLFPALGAFSVGVAWGALTLSRGRWQIALAAVTLPLLGIALWAGSILPEEFAKRM